MTARGWLVFVGLGIVWGLPYLFIKLAVAEISPFDVAWGRITLAALRTHTAPVCAFALLEFAVPYSLIAASEQWIPSSVAGILISTVPLSMLAMARLFGVRERLGAQRLAGLVLGVLGVSALVGFGTIAAAHGWAGIACMFVVTICYAAGPLLVQRHLHTVDSIGALAASLIVASLALAVPAALTLPRRAPGTLALASVAVLGLLCTAVSMLGMFYLIKQAGAARTALITYINPVIATALGALVLHEQLGWSGPIGLALILVSVRLASAGASAEPLPAAEPG